MVDIQTTKQNFINRQTELDDRLTSFSDNYETWIASLPDDVIPLVLLMLDHFDYYSHSDANTMLQQLHQKLLSQECEEDNALYTYIKKKKGIISSSVDYWGEYRIQNRINKNFCTDDIDALPQQDWELIENIVIIDDCCGTGGSLDKFIYNSKKDFAGKTIYYLVLHALEDAQNTFTQIESKYTVNVKLIAINIRKKASTTICETTPEEVQQKILQASADLQIPEPYCLGKDNSEGLMAFYNNTPNNTIGLFWLDTENYSSIFPRDFGAKPKWRPSISQMRGSRKQRKDSNYMAVKKNG